MQHSKNERLVFVIEALKDQRLINNASDFAKIIEKPRSYISELVNGKRELTEGCIKDIVKRFPQVSPIYLLTGVKPMFVNQTAANATAISTMAGGVVNNIATRGDEKIISPTGDVSIEPHHAELIALREENKALKDKVALLERIISEKETIIELLKK